MKLASLAMAAFVVAAPISSRAQLGATAKPSAGQATTSNVSVPPAVTFEQLPTYGRRMIVTLLAPRSEATLGRPADVREVVLKSDTWYCEPGNEGQTETTGIFVSMVRSQLEGYVQGRTNPSSSFRALANDPDLDAFAANLFGGNRARVKVNGRQQYGGPVPGQFAFNDCYTVQEMQAIKSEVARILGLSN